MSDLRVNESVEVSTVGSCCLCGSSGSRIVERIRDRVHAAPGSWAFLECPKCGLIWIDPFPTAAAIGRLYGDNYYTHPLEAQARGRIRGAFKEFKQRLLAAILSSLGYTSASSSRLAGAFGAIISRCVPFRSRALYKIKWLIGPARGLLLDVGFGGAEFLLLMRHLGWEVRGVDPDPVVVKHASESHALDVRCATLESAGFLPNTFDVITMSHSIEHVSAPIEVLNECKRILKPGGRLILVTPNAASLGRHVFEDSWFSWDVPRHLVLFTPESLATAATKAGLVIKEIRTGAMFARLIYRQSALIRKHGHLSEAAHHPVGGAIKVRALLFWLWERLLIRYKPIGEELILVATKGDQWIHSGSESGIRNQNGKRTDLSGHIESGLLFAAGLLLGTANAFRHRIRGYRTPRPFSSRHIARSVQYAIHVVDRWIDRGNIQFAGERVLELGPGPDLGTGIVALSKGARSYLALDQFPLARSTSREFYFELQEKLGYTADWNLVSYKVVDFPNLHGVNGEYDLIVSNATLEHIADVQGTFLALRKLCAPGAKMCHHVDAKTHIRALKTIDPWNIQRFPHNIYNRLMTFPGSPNRLLASDYIKALENAGFSEVRVIPGRTASSLQSGNFSNQRSARLADRPPMDFRYLSFTVVASVPTSGP